ACLNRAATDKTSGAQIAQTIKNRPSEKSSNSELDGTALQISLREGSLKGSTWYSDGIGKGTRLGGLFDLIVRIEVGPKVCHWKNFSTTTTASRHQYFVPEKMKPRSGDLEAKTIFSCQGGNELLKPALVITFLTFECHRALAKNECQFLCDETRCIENSKRCNGVADCDDLSDENGCVDSKCEFMCDVTKCIENTRRCDGVDDCADLTDERNCLEGEASAFAVPRITRQESKGRRRQRRQLSILTKRRKNRTLPMSITRISVNRTSDNLKGFFLHFPSRNRRKIAAEILGG
ncbi:unnamed protein product, partial [Nesidiocoris tenuis]